MENDNFLNDDFLRSLVGKSTIESPSGGFVEKVMGRIQPQAEVTPVSKSFFLNLKSYVGYLLIASVLTGFFWTSDIPVLSWLPGKQYFINSILPSFDYLFAWLKSLSVNSSGISIPVMILAASGLFFLVDRLLTNRNSAGEYPSA